MEAKRRYRILQMPRVRVALDAISRGAFLARSPARLAPPFVLMPGRAELARLMASQSRARNQPRRPPYERTIQIQVSLQRREARPYRYVDSRRHVAAPSLRITPKALWLSRTAQISPVV
jgi:hypothetical protein